MITLKRGEQSCVSMEPFLEATRLSAAETIGTNGFLTLFLVLLFLVLLLSSCCSCRHGADNPSPMRDPWYPTNSNSRAAIAKVSRGYGQRFLRFNEDVQSLGAPIGNVFSSSAPDLAVMWLSGQTSTLHLRDLLWRPVLKLELVEIRPSITCAAR